MSRTPLIAGNWKMNGLMREGLALSKAVAAGSAQLPGIDLVICPPATLPAAVRPALAGSRVALGAQDCHPAPSGAHTGDVAAPMLAELGCRWVIVGHSERRANHGENDALVRAKAKAAHAAGLGAIVCVGETLAERDAGHTLAVVGRQLAGSLPDESKATDVVVAYEPVWAIGTGRAATTEQVGEVHAAIRRLLAKRFADGAALRVLYGGSVNPANASELIGLADVDGALVGGASLKAESFLAIARGAGGSLV